MDYSLSFVKLLTNFCKEEALLQNPRFLLSFPQPLNRFSTQFSLWIRYSILLSVNPCFQQSIKIRFGLAFTTAIQNDNKEHKLENGNIDKIEMLGWLFSLPFLLSV